MKNFLQKQREILAILLYVAFIAALIYVVILPLIAKIGSVRNQIQQEALKQESNRKRLNELPKIQEQYSGLEKNAAAIDALLDKNKAVILIERLEKLAEESGNEIAITVNAPAPAAAKVSASAKAKVAQDNGLVTALPSSNYLQLKITLSGDFNAVNKFINSLDSLEYYCDVVEIQIKKSEASAQKKPVGLATGSANPFSGAGQLGAAGEVASAEDGILDSSLSVVFYTK